MTKRLSVTNVTGLLLACFVGNSLNIDVFCSSTKRSVYRNVKCGGRFFQTKLLSRLSHTVCLRLSSPVLLHKFTIFERCNGTIMGDSYGILAKRTMGKERGKKKKKETRLHAHALPSFYILKISRKLKKITSYADFLRRSP